METLDCCSSLLKDCNWSRLFDQTDFINASAMELLMHSVMPWCWSCIIFCSWAFGDPLQFACPQRGQKAFGRSPGSPCWESGAITVWMTPSLWRWLPDAARAWQTKQSFSPACCDQATGGASSLDDCAASWRLPQDDAAAVFKQQTRPLALGQRQPSTGSRCRQFAALGEGIGKAFSGSIRSPRSRRLLAQASGLLGCGCLRVIPTGAQ